MPGETDLYFNETVNFVKRLKVSFIVAHFVNPFRGTKLYDDLVKDGIIPADFVLGIDSYNQPIFSTKDFTTQDLLRRRKRLLLEFYINHIPAMLWEFFGGRLNWITSSMVKRILNEKLFDYPGENQNNF
jgi:radical SAM superfamily enzyme YgiQ (UPF0313 family)